MKIRPEIILNNNKKITYNKILVTGSDESLINYVRDYVVKSFKKDKYFIDTTGSFNKGIAGDLFSDKKVLFILKDFFYKKEDLEINALANQCLLIISTSNKKTNIIKNNFSKEKNSLVVECYPLNRKSKELVLKQCIEEYGIKVSNNIFWYIVENLDNQYVLFVNQLKAISLLSTKIDSEDIIEKAVFVENKIELNKLFFNIFKNNKYLINIFNKNIFSNTDFYIFLNSLKQYLEIISISKNIDSALLRFPKFLFNEKDAFIKIYSLLDKQKILQVYKNISKVEILIRKNPNLYNVVGLRFLLSAKKIITS